MSSAAQNQAGTGLVIIRGKKEAGGETKTEHGGGVWEVGGIFGRSRPGQWQSRPRFTFSPRPTFSPITENSDSVPLD